MISQILINLYSHLDNFNGIWVVSCVFNVFGTLGVIKHVLHHWAWTDGWRLTAELRNSIGQLLNALIKGDVILIVFVGVESDKIDTRCRPKHVLTLENVGQAAHARQFTA